MRRRKRIIKTMKFEYALSKEEIDWCIGIEMCPIGTVETVYSV